jgi:feruloyl esterase
MTHKLRWAAGVALILTVAPAFADDPACTSLLGRELGGAHVTTAQAVDATPGWTSPGAAPGGPVTLHTAFCRVFASVGEHVGFELWLPPSTVWNHRLLSAGVGGSAGTYNYRLLKRGVERAYAVSSTDAGHTLADVNWIQDPAEADDYAHRAVHVVATAAKAIVADYYRQAAKYAYFEGCSGGGREALKELQRYPQDYDGILAGAPGPDMPRLSVRHMLAGLWQQQAGINVTQEDWDLVQQQAVQACDANDGLTDGVVEDPRSCHVELDALACSADKTSACIPPDRLALVKRIVAPIHDEDGNFTVDGLLPGVRSRPGPPPDLILALFGQGVHHSDHWDPNQFNIKRDLAGAYAAYPEIRADDPNVQPFAARGGKVIIYQGWYDPSVIAQQTVRYYTQLVQHAGGEKKAANFSRLYLVPGMYHCGGGDSTDRFGGEAGSYSSDPDRDLLEALVQWREKGRAPQTITAARVVDGRTLRTRPLCAYPAVARYRGSGDPDAAASFTCSVPADSALPPH